MKKHIFVDTNILLHFKIFSELDWPAIVSQGTAKILFAPIVVRELDEHKIGGSSRKVRERARVVIGKLKEIQAIGSFRINEREIEVSFLSNEPQVDWHLMQLDPTINDDRLLASMLLFSQSEKIPLDQLTLVTNDFGLYLKATARRIATIELPDSFALTLIEDPTDSELKKAKGELQKLRIQFPKLNIHFAGGFTDIDHKDFVLKQARPAPTELETSDRTKEVEAELLRKVPALNTPSSTKQTLGELMGIVAVSPERIKEYRDAIASYVQAYPSYVKKQYESRERLSRCLRLDLVLSNSGGAPADDSDVFLHFPDGFDLIAQEPLEIGIPEPPKPPKNMLQELQESLSYSRNFPDLSYLTPRGHTISAPNVSSLQITRTNSYDVRLAVNKIKHNMEIALDPMWVVFPAYDSAKSFSFRYEILTANFPDQFRGELHVIIQKV
jgi:hypothetical protein